MIRVIPILIILMVAMIGAKVLDVLDILPDYLNVSATQAADGVENDDKQPENKEETKKEEAGEENGQDDGNQKPLPKSAIGSVDAPDTSCNPAQKALLEKLGERSKQLDLRENEISIRENSLNLIEKNLSTKIIQLQNLQRSLKLILEKYENKEDEKIKSLVKVYEAMKPQDAAKIFEQIEMDILLEVAFNMKEAKLAQILSKMDPKKATELTINLVSYRKTEGME